MILSDAIPSIAKINSKAADVGLAIEKVLSIYRADALSISERDGLAHSFNDCRLDLLRTKTERTSHLRGAIAECFRSFSETVRMQHE